MGPGSSPPDTCLGDPLPLDEDEDLLPRPARETGRAVEVVDGAVSGGRYLGRVRIHSQLQKRLLAGVTARHLTAFWTESPFGKEREREREGMCLKDGREEGKGRGCVVCVRGIKERD